VRWAFVRAMSDLAASPTLTCKRLAFALALALPLAIVDDEALAGTFSFVALGFAFALRCAAVLGIMSLTTASVTHGTFTNHADLLFALLPIVGLGPLCLLLCLLMLVPLFITSLLVLVLGLRLVLMTA